MVSRMRGLRCSAARGATCVRSFALLAATLVCGFAPGLAHANKLKVASYELQASAGVIELEADAPLDEPSVKVNGSTVRVWFPGIDKLSRFDQGDSEQPIRAVHLRPGAGGTALLSVELGGELGLTRDDVELSRQGSRARLRISLPVLPAQTPPSAAPAAQAGPIAQPATPQPGSIVAPPSAPVLAPPEVPQFKGGAVAAGASAAPAPAAKPARPSEPKLLENRQGLSTLQLLLLLTLALGAVYGALRLGLHRRAASAPHPSIVVLGSKRLGPRHQLLIVRALGQDHLLSINGGRTERIMSTETDPAAEPPAPPAPSVRSADPNEGVDPVGSGMAATLRSLRSQELFKQSAGATKPRRAPEGSDAQGSTFGAELLDFVGGQHSDAAGVPQTSPRPRLAESEAIAGLVRLRKRSV